MPCATAPGQLILGLLICFITYGLYAGFAPYADPRDDMLATICQVSIFFSLVASIVTRAWPEDDVMRVLLPMLVIVPPLLAFMFESPLLDELNKLFLRDEEGKLGRWGAAVLTVCEWFTFKLDQAIGTRRSGALRTGRLSLIRVNHQTRHTSQGVTIGPGPDDDNQSDCAVSEWGVPIASAAVGSAGTVEEGLSLESVELEAAPGGSDAPQGDSESRKASAGSCSSESSKARRERGSPLPQWLSSEELGSGATTSAQTHCDAHESESRVGVGLG